jgi:hypothetical protein
MKHSGSFHILKKIGVEMADHRRKVALSEFFRNLNPNFSRLRKNHADPNSQDFLS